MTRHPLALGILQYVAAPRPRRASCRHSAKVQRASSPELSTAHKQPSPAATRLQPRTGSAVVPWWPRKVSQQAVPALSQSLCLYTRSQSTTRQQPVLGLLPSPMAAATTNVPRVSSKSLVATPPPWPSPALISGPGQPQPGQPCLRMSPSCVLRSGHCCWCRGGTAPPGHGTRAAWLEASMLSPGAAGEEAQSRHHASPHRQREGSLESSTH